MFRTWSYRKKNSYFLVACALILVLGYLLGIRKTIDLYQENATLSEGLADADNSKVELIALTRQKQRLDSILGSVYAEEEEELLLRQLTRINLPPVQLVRYSEVTQRSTGSRFSVFRFEGPYAGLGQLLHEVEQRNYGGAVASVKFEVETDRRTKVSRLYLEMYFAK